ncbi:MAG: mechanosensitive ion channel [Thermodesulfobacteriota bacterium]|nr:mechanosensitive ion channel [Thermodesulfobacteriota bacterium]
MSEKTILELVTKIEPQIFLLLLKLLAVGVIVLMFKGFVESVVAYLQIRLDKRLGLGVRVRVRGVEGKIIDYNLSWIVIETKEGSIIVSVRRWRWEQWALLNGE